MAAHADPLFAGAHPKPVLFASQATARGVPQLHANRLVGGHFHVERPVRGDGCLAQQLRLAGRVPGEEAHGVDLPHDGTLRLAGVQTEQVAVLPCGRQPGGKVTRRNARRYRYRLHGIQPARRLHARGNPRLRPRQVDGIRAAGARTGGHQPAIRRQFRHRTGDFQVGGRQFLLHRQRRAETGQPARDRENHVARRDLPAAGTQRPVVAAQGFDAGSIGIHREKLAAPFEKDAAVVEHIIGQIPARSMRQHVRLAAAEGRHLDGRPALRHPGVGHAPVGQIQGTNAGIGGGDHPLRRTAGEIGLPDLPAVLAGGAAGKQDAASVVGDGGVGRREEARNYLARPIRSRQNQVRAVWETLPAMVPCRRLIARRRSVEKRGQIVSYRVSGKEAGKDREYRHPYYPPHNSIY